MTADLTLHIHDRLGDIDPHEWDSGPGRDSFYASHGWLRALEHDPDLSARYVVARDRSGVLLGALPVYLWGGTGGWVASSYDASQVARLVLGDRVKREEWFPLLLVGARAGYGHEIVASSAEVRRCLVARAIELGDQLGARAIVARLASRAGVDGLLATHHGFTPLLAPPALRLETSWQDFEGYLASHNAHRRAPIVRELKRFGDSRTDIAIERISELGDAGPRLLACVQQKHGHSDPEAVLAATIEAIAREANDSSRVFVARRRDDVLGYSVAHEHAGILWLRFVGLDHDQPQSDAIYFNVCYYAPIRYAIERGLRAVDLGIGSYRPKLMRGGRPRPLYDAIRPPSHLAAELQAGAAAASVRELERWTAVLAPFAAPSADWLPVSAASSP